MGRLPIIRSQVFFLRTGKRRRHIPHTGEIRCKCADEKQERAAKPSPGQGVSIRREPPAKQRGCPSNKKGGHGLYIPPLANHAPCSVPKSIPHPGEILVNIHLAPHGTRIAHTSRQRGCYQPSPRRLTLRGASGESN